MEEKNIKILAIESSCDETAAAVVENGRKVLSNVISTQIDIHTLMAVLFQKLPQESISSSIIRW